MKIKLLNVIMADKKLRKRLFIVVKEYDYCGEKFYCVKTRRFSPLYKVGVKYDYIEPKTGCRISLYRLFEKKEPLTEHQFKKRMRKLVALAARNGQGRNIHEVIASKLR